MTNLEAAQRSYASFCKIVEHYEKPVCRAEWECYDETDVRNELEDMGIDPNEEFEA